MNPSRIQRKRTKGWRMPKGAVYVGRPSRWGNPFRCEKTPWGWAVVEASPRRTTATPYWLDKHGAAFEAAVFATRLFELHHGPMGSYEYDVDEVRAALRGRDLACWCPLTDVDGEPFPCHADVLLRIANGEPS